MAGEANMKRNYGWIPDIPDQRDFLYRAVMRPPAVLPKKVDLRKDCSPVEDQEVLGSCTANALAGISWKPPATVGIIN
jgi:C1A family cysteine protease